jgi:O-antigen ligase
MRRLHPSRWGAAACVALVALVVAVLVGYRPGLDDGRPALQPRGLQVAVAQSQLLIDAPDSVIVDTTLDTKRPSRSAAAYVQLLQTPDMVRRIAGDAGVPAEQVSAAGPFTLRTRRAAPAPDGEAFQLGRRTDGRYKLVFDVEYQRPMLTLYSSAPDTATATRLLRAAERALRQAVGDIQRRAVGDEDPVAIRSLGPPTARVIGAGAPRSLAIAVFAALLAIGWTALALVRRRTVRREDDDDRQPWDQPPGPGGDWPRTGRVLPWALAAFLTMLWLVPFDAMQLPIPIPLDGKLDRPVLVAILLLWIGALLAAAPGIRPRLRLGPVHAAVLAFFAVCVLGAAVNAPALVNLGELDQVLKKLVLLGSYVVFFVIVASVVRPREVPRLAALLLGLSLVAGIGAVLEFRLQFNPFYTVASAILPGDVTKPQNLYGLDSIGRREIYGAAGHPLELATMLGVALPFALVAFLDARTARSRWLSAVVAAVLLAGAIATLRKTSIIAPIAGCAVLLAYRPWSSVRRLLPLVLVLVVVIHTLAPGALGSTVAQLSPSDFSGGQSTQDRVSDYDGVRPDVVTHLLLGRGYESYDPHKYRILDNEYLGLLVGVGLAGVAAYLLMAGTAFAAAHGAARRNTSRAGPALAIAAAVIVLLVATALFDLLSFPHISYLLFFLVGLAAVLRTPSATPAPSGWAELRDAETLAPPQARKELTRS